MNIPADELRGTIVVTTQLRKIPESCSKCKYYDSMGGNPGRWNSGVCSARATLWSTEHIRVTKERLENCPLRYVTAGKKKAADA